MGGGVLDTFFDDGARRDEINKAAERKFIQSVGGVDEATKIRGIPEGSNVADATVRRDTYGKHAEQYEAQGKTKLAEDARLNQSIQQSILNALNEQNGMVKQQGEEAKKPKKFVPATNPKPVAPRPSAQIGGG